MIEGVVDYRQYAELSQVLAVLVYECTWGSHFVIYIESSDCNGVNE